MADAAVARPSAQAFEARLLSSSSIETTTSLPRKISALVASLIPPQTATVAEKKPTNILSLPTELHLHIMSYLDPLDGTCMGLANRHFYQLYRRNLMLPVPLPTGQLSLSTVTSPESSPQQPASRPSLGPRKITPLSLVSRRIGKNNQEWAFTRYKSGVQCRFCGVERCQLWRHVRELFPEGEWEYCGVSGRFSRIEGEEQGNNEGCWRSCPPRPSRCGKHSRGESGSEVSRL